MQQKKSPKALAYIQYQHCTVTWAHHRDLLSVPQSRSVVTENNLVMNNGWSEVFALSQSQTRDNDMALLRHSTLHSASKWIVCVFIGVWYEIGENDSGQTVVPWD